MFNVIPFRAARNLMNTSMDDMLSDRFFRNFFDMSDMVGTAGFRVDVKEQPDAYVLEAELPGVKQDDIDPDRRGRRADHRRRHQQRKEG